jgi:hypothetical protein
VLSYVGFSSPWTFVRNGITVYPGEDWRTLFGRVGAYRVRIKSKDGEIQEAPGVGSVERKLNLAKTASDIMHVCINDVMPVHYSNIDTTVGFETLSAR